MNIKTEYVVRWAEFEAEDDELEILTPISEREFEEWPVKPGINIHNGTYKHVSFDTEKEAQTFANEVIELYPGDDIKWLALCEVDKRTTETISKLK
jgi:hypothetical protein